MPWRTTVPLLAPPGPHTALASVPHATAQPLHVTRIRSSMSLSGRQTRSCQATHYLRGLTITGTLAGVFLGARGLECPRHERGDRSHPLPTRRVYAREAFPAPDGPSKSSA